MARKVYYYSDPLHDDFAGNDIKTVPTPADFEYIPHSTAFRLVGNILYFGVAKPVTWIFNKVVFHHRFINKKVIKPYRKTGRFYFGNHTLEAGDAFIPNHISAGRNYIVTSPDATSIKGIRTIVQMFGALPVPSGVGGARRFCAAVTELTEKRHSVTVYPEAHIWPRYTKIRPFGAESFTMPAETGAPCFSFTNVYFRSRIPFIKRPVVKTYVNGPFFPDMSLPKRERAKDLRDRVYGSMVYEAEKQEQYVTDIYIEKKEP